MKFILALIAVSLLGLTAKAETITKESNPELLKSYINAVKVELDKYKVYHCSSALGNYPIKQILDFRYVTEVRVYDGAEPLLAFKSRAFEGGSGGYVSVYTDADYKIIKTLTYTTFRKGLMNVGDLKNPKMVEAEIPVSSCEVKVSL